MAILDNELIMSNAQVETTIAAHASTNIIDFGKAGAGYNWKVLVTMNAAVTATGAATVSFIVQTDGDVAFGSPTDLFTRAATAKATLVAGYKVLEYTLPAEVERYVRVVYTIATDTLITGKFNAWVDDVQQTNMTII